MTELEELHSAIEAAFVQTSRDSPRWPDPNPDRRSLPDDAYSRVTDPAKWRILQARTDAWLIALVQCGLATVEREANVTWRRRPQLLVSRTERAIPVGAGALALVIAHSRIGDIDDAGVILGVGNPAERVNLFPDCGCDACDSGSQNELDHLDAHLVGIITGSFRRLSDGERVITVIDRDSWTATGFFAAAGRHVKDVLADAHGWSELTGSSWLGATNDVDPVPR